jgi:predicted nucleotidyltransferase
MLSVQEPIDPFGTKQNQARRTKHLEIINKTIKQIFNGDILKPTSIYLYGSIIRNDYSNNSNINILIIWKQQLDTIKNEIEQFEQQFNKLVEQFNENESDIFGRGYDTLAYEHIDFENIPIQITKQHLLDDNMNKSIYELFCLFGHDFKQHHLLIFGEDMLENFSPFDPIEVAQILFPKYFHQCHQLYKQTNAARQINELFIQQFNILIRLLFMLYGFTSLHRSVYETSYLPIQRYFPRLLLLHFQYMYSPTVPTGVPQFLMKENDLKHNTMIVSGLTLKL